MKIAIFENIMTPGGHEVDFDRILVEELRALGHEISFYVPEEFQFGMDYHVPVHRLKGEVVTYTGLHGIKKICAAVRREYRRQNWYKQLYQESAEGNIDAIIIPTASYRYLRTLRKNILKNAPIPIVLILHGIRPDDTPTILREAEKLLPYPNIKLVTLTLTQNIFGKRLKNICSIVPPAYIPRDIDAPLENTKKETLTIGFFGQYRREKKLEDFLAVFMKRVYTRPVKLIVQGATTRPEDAADFDRIIRKYEGRKNIEFLHKGLIGADWQRMIADVDTMLMPYAAERYRYQCSAMLFTAIGFGKPVVVSDEMNPEVFESFHIGETFPSGDMEALGRTIEHFINNYEVNAPKYHAELARAAEQYAPRKLAARLTELISKS